MLRNKQASAQDAALQSRSSTSGYFVRGTSNTNRQNLSHVFIDFKQAFDRVLHSALWATMRLYNINTNLINAIQNLYDKATSAVCFNGSTGGWFRTTVGVRQGCLLSPTLFKRLLERIMADALNITNRQSALEPGQSQTYVLLMT